MTFKCGGRRALLTLVLTGTCAAACLWPDQSALADEFDISHSVGNPHSLQFSANVTLTSDYRDKGYTSTDEGPAIQGGFDINWGGINVGLWASNTDFGAATKPNGQSVDIANLEIDYYAGLIRPIGDAELLLAVLYTTYPNAYDPGAELDYLEYSVGISRPVISDLVLGIFIHYAQEYSGEIGENWIYEGSFEKPLPDIGPFGVSLSGTIGFHDGDEGKGNIDFWHWDVGIKLGFHEIYTLDIRYFDTEDVPHACKNLCDAAAVISLSAFF